MSQDQINKLKFLVDYIREWMRDQPELNRLVDGQEHSDRLIAMAIYDTQEKLSMMTPPINATSYPLPLLRLGATIFLLQSLGLLMTRNQLNYRTGRGTGIGIQDKTPLLQNWIQMLNAEFTTLAKEWKISQNLESAMGSSVLHSEYSLINGLYGYWGLMS